MPIPPAAIVLTPGASADRDHSTLVAIEGGLPEIEVLRLTLGTTSAPRGAKLITEAAVAAADRLGVDQDQVALGGRSFGGRCSSIAHAEGLQAHSLLLLSYPLHPPGKPDKLRTEHFGQITAPCLLLSGERDPFGSPDEFASHLGSIPGEVTTRWVPGNHSPKDEAGIVEHIRHWYGLA